MLFFHFKMLHYIDYSRSKKKEIFFFFFELNETKYARPKKHLKIKVSTKNPHFCSQRARFLAGAIAVVNPCGGSAICVHGRQRSTCKPCGGSIYFSLF